MEKRVQYKVFTDTNSLEVVTVADVSAVGDDDEVVGLKIPYYMGDIMWMTENDAKQIIKALNATMRELK